MAVQKFIFGGDTGETPESIRSQRAYLAQAMFAGAAPKDVGEGLNSIGRSIAAAIMGRQLDEAEKAGQASAMDAIRASSLFGGDGMASMPAPTPTGDASAAQAQTGAPSPAGKLPIMGYAVGNTPAVSTDETGAKLNEYFEGNARSLGMTNPVFDQRLLTFLNDNPYGVGIRSLDRSVDQQAQLYARYQQQGGAPVAPPGRSNHNKGLAADLSYEDPRATAWAHANAGRYGLNFPLKSENWHVEPMENRGMRFAGAQAGQGQASPVQMADASGQVPLPPVRPPELGGAAPMPPARPADLGQAERLPVPPGQYLAQRQAAMDQAAREDIPARPAAPVLGANGLPSPFVKRQAGNGGGPSPAAPQQSAAPAQMGGSLSPGDRAALANAFVPQWIKEAIIKKATRDPMAQEQARVNLERSKLELAAFGDRNKTTEIKNYEYAKANGFKGNFADYQKGAAPNERGLTPQFGVDAEGNPVMLQLGKDGTATVPQMPPGVRLSKEPIKMDAGTHFVLLDPITRQQVGIVPKENRQAAAETARGKVEGKQQAEDVAALDGSIAKAENMLGIIGKLRTHPGRQLGTGLTFGMGAVPGTSAYDFARLNDQAKGQAFLEAFASLKGGGAITEVEGQKATDAIARLDRAQSEEGYLSALSDLESVVRAGMDRARGKAGRANGGSYSPTAPGSSPPVRVNTPDEAMKLPKGTRFVDPSGKMRVVP